MIDKVMRPKLEKVRRQKRRLLIRSTRKLSHTSMNAEMNATAALIILRSNIGLNYLKRIRILKKRISRPFQLSAINPQIR
jgi:hypothetical protein